MKPQKTVLIVFGIGIILIIFLYILMSFSKPITTPTTLRPTATPMVSLPMMREITPITSETIKVNDVQIKNVTKNSKFRDATGISVFYEDPSFELIFDQANQEFTLSILDTPFETQRIKAENKFVELIGVPKEEACRLTVFESTPNYVDPNEVGKVYPLSFCTHVEE